MDTLGSTLLTLLIPIVWGISSAWVFDWIRARRSREADADDGLGEDEIE